MTFAPRLTLRDIALYERATPFAKPFRFGAVTVEGTGQAFIRVEIAVEGAATAIGATAELMVPKWFDKTPALSIADTVDELRRALFIAREVYLAPRARLTAFALHAEAYGEHMARCAAEGIPPLAAAFGPAQIDKAILDALLRALGLSVFEGLGRNIAGLDNRLTPDIADADIARFLVSRALASRAPLAAVAVRHTVGMLDPLGGAGGLPAILAAHGCRHVKIKLGGDPAADLARVAAIDAALITASLDYRASLDANEQYADLAALSALCDGLDRLAGFDDRLLYIEQPLPRETTLATPLGALAERRAIIIDEADDSYEAFPQALALGYRGISSKACKGLHKSLLNGARAMVRREEAGERAAFIAAEDLTCQAGLALQQDTALAAFHGIAHAERNGHHYAGGFVGAGEAEIAAFAAAHPDLYRVEDGATRLRIVDGAISTRSLACPGFACAAMPDWSSLPPMKDTESA